MKRLSLTVAALAVVAAASGPEHLAAHERGQEPQLEHYASGMSALGRGDLENAEVELRRALEIDPDFSQAHGTLGILLVARGHKAQAVTSFEAALSAAHVHDVGIPAEAVETFNLATFHLRQGELALAQRELARITESTVPLAPALVRLGEIYLDEGLATEATTTLQSAIATGANGWRPHFLLARGHTRLLQHDLALEHLDRALDIDPGNIDVSLAIADVYRVLGSVGEAGARYAEIVHTAPNDPRAYFRSAQAAAGTRDFAGAVKHLEVVLTLQPAHAGAHYLLGMVHSRQQDFRAAEGYLRAAVKLAPDEPQGHYALGTALMAQGKVEEAEEELQTFSEMQARRQRVDVLQKQVFVEPVDAGLRYQLAEAYEELGQLSAAERQLRFGLLLEPEHEAARLLLEDIGRRLRRDGGPAGRAQSDSARAELESPRYSDATASSGLVFHHRHGGTGERYMVETMGPGVVLADFDRDGRLDVYFVQGAATPGLLAEPTPRNMLFRNLGEGTFVPVAAGIAPADPGYGQGAAAADYDGDGFTDLYVTNFGPNRLYRNNGDGTFTDVTDGAGVGDALWGTSAAWADVDTDGDLDLFVVNYVDFGWDNHKLCGDTRRDLYSYCHPDVYNGLPDRLYINQGDGTFVESGEAAGIANRGEGKGLGVVFADYDDDGDLDIYVANDSTRNFLYTNAGDGTFADDSLLAGVGYNEDGRAEAGMGTDWGDYDGDGLLDVVVTNLALETNTLYRNLGAGLFIDVSFASGIGEPSFRFVGFGANWLDYDNDGDLDLLIANGHIIDNIVEVSRSLPDSPLVDRTYAQVNHLYRNDGIGGFEEIHDRAGDGMQLVKVSRGTAIGDVDNDGDLDIVVANNNQTADYLRNDGGNRAGNWIQLTLVSSSGNRGGVGARAWFRIAETGVPAGGGAVGSEARHRTLVAEVKAGSSYASSSDIRLHTGLGRAETVSVSVRWPGGETQDLGSLAANHHYVVRQGRGVVARR